MNELDKLKAWIETFPGYASLSGFCIDYADKIPGSAGLFPDGLTEVDRKKDLLGNVTVTNRYSFAVYCVFEKPPGDDVGAEINADWVSDFQAWVQTQSATGRAPQFGDDPNKEKILAQNGAIFRADKEGTAVYAVNLSVQCIKRFCKEG